MPNMLVPDVPLGISAAPTCFLNGVLTKSAPVGVPETPPFLPFGRGSRFWRMPLLGTLIHRAAGCASDRGQPAAADSLTADRSAGFFLKFPNGLHQWFTLSKYTFSAHCPT